MYHFVQSLGAQQRTRQTHPYITKFGVLWGYKQDPGDYRHVRLMISAIGGKEGY